MESSPARIASLTIGVLIFLTHLSASSSCISVYTFPSEISFPEFRLYTEVPPPTSLLQECLSIWHPIKPSFKKTSPTCSFRFLFLCGVKNSWEPVYSALNNSSARIWASEADGVALIEFFFKKKEKTTVCFLKLQKFLRRCHVIVFPF